MNAKAMVCMAVCFLLTGWRQRPWEEPLWREGETWYPGVKTDIAGDPPVTASMIIIIFREHYGPWIRPLSFIGDTLMLPIDYFHGPWSIHSGK
ncbi:putative lipoprotein [Klebsiella michiganensis]|nr:putative lipoprotein [Klebsiella michiganensis]